MYTASLSLLISLVVSIQGFYSPNDDVIELDASNFDRQILHSSDLWIVEFYAPWCGRKSSED